MGMTSDSHCLMPAYHSQKRIQQLRALDGVEEQRLADTLDYQRVHDPYLCVKQDLKDEKSVCMPFLTDKISLLPPRFKKGGVGGTILGIAYIFLFL